MSRILITVFVLLSAAPLWAAEAVGNAEFTRGAVTAGAAGGEVRLMGAGSPIYPNDVLSTAQKSAAVLKLNDGTRMVLRPDTVFGVEQYTERAQQESAVMRLFKGGLRAVSGFISKRNPNAFRIATTTATIGIRGTEFDARLCGNDCKEETQAAPAAGQENVAARTAFVKGQVHAISADQRSRALQVGSPLYPSDVIRTAAGALAVLVFRDQTKITLRPDSEFVIERHQYGGDQARGNNALFRLLKGGFRAVTGLIAQYQPSAQRFAIPVGTIGIRGTRFDVLCGGAEGIPKKGCQVYVKHGSVAVEREHGVLVIDQGKTYYFADKSAAPVEIPTPPKLIPDDNDASRLEGVDAGFDDLSAGDEAGDPGLYVSCYAGECVMQIGDRRIELRDGQAGYASMDGATLKHLDHPPSFQINDVHLQLIDPQARDNFHLLQPDAEREFECAL